MSATDQVAANDAMVRGEATTDERRATEAARNASDLTTRDDFTIPARQRWDQSQVAVIKQTVAKDCNDAELAMFLEVAARYHLDPFLRQIFAAKFDGPNGPVTIFAGRDGLLVAAKGEGGKTLRHMESHVVREKDEFEKIIDTDAMHLDAESGVSVARLRKLRHVQRGMGSEQRGPIVGGYALVFLEGEEAPWYAEATWEDYGATKQQTTSGKKTNWTVGKGFTEAMMIKVPQSIALRMAKGLTGLYAQEEVQRKLDERAERGGQQLSGDGDTPGVDYPESEIGMTLQALVSRANELVPRSWAPAKVAMLINGKDQAGLEEAASKLRRFIAGRAPQDPLAQEPDTVTDAVVVPDDAGEKPASESEAPAEPEAAEPQPAAEEASSEQEAAPVTAGPAQGPLAKGMVRAMEKHDSVRIAVEERLEELRAAVGNELAVAGLGFDDEDQMLEEIDRLDSAVKAVTDGGPTVAEEIAPEEPSPTRDVEWDPEEHEQLRHAIVDLETALEEATEGTAKRTMESNLEDAVARLKALEDARDGQGQ